ncbi:MAG: 4-hydroxyphenylpyruvate dioxygenase [Candidatus Eisenbacteria bacterium]
MQQAPALPIREIDHVEFYVGNARQAAHFYRTAFGLDQIGYRGPETGARDRASYLLTQGNIRFVLTTPLEPEGPIARHIAKHGDGVRDIALRVDDATAVYEQALARGARSVEAPTVIEGMGGRIKRAAIATYGDTIHSFIERDGIEAPLLPGFREERRSGGGAGLAAIDHMVGNVEDEKMDAWVDYYRDVFGFEHFLTFDDKDISTEYTALRSKVVSSANHRVKFPINEPAPGKRRSQIQEYLDYYHGPGVQHIALLTGDILRTIGELRARGVEFLEVPDSYYEALSERVGPIAEDIERLREHRILVDRDDEGYLLQLFTRPVEDRPTLFFEVIQRRGSRGFGKGNFKALFEAIEREQALRGNL